MYNWGVKMVSKSEAFNTPRKVHVMTLVSMQLRTCGVKISDSILCSVSNHTRGACVSKNV